jgi:hypothetical protein
LIKFQFIKSNDESIHLLPNNSNNITNTPESEVNLNSSPVSLSSEVFPPSPVTDSPLSSLFNRDYHNSFYSSPDKHDDFRLFFLLITVLCIYILFFNKSRGKLSNKNWDKTPVHQKAPCLLSFYFFLFFKSIYKVGIDEHNESRVNEQEINENLSNQSKSLPSNGFFS